MKKMAPRQHTGVRQTVMKKATKKAKVTSVTVHPSETKNANATSYKMSFDEWDWKVTVTYNGKISLTPSPSTRRSGAKAVHYDAFHPHRQKRPKITIGHTSYYLPRLAPGFVGGTS